MMSSFGADWWKETTAHPQSPYITIVNAIAYINNIHILYIHMYLSVNTLACIHNHNLLFRTFRYNFLATGKFKIIRHVYKATSFRNQTTCNMLKLDIQFCRPTLLSLIFVTRWLFCLPLSNLDNDTNFIDNRHYIWTTVIVIVRLSKFPQMQLKSCMDTRNEVYHNLAIFHKII